MRINELAAGLSISRQMLFRYRRRPDAPASLDLNAWRAYLRCTEKPRAHRSARLPDPRADGAPYDYVYERARKVALSADILSIELSAAKRNTVSKAEVKTMFNGLRLVCGADC